MLAIPPLSSRALAEFVGTMTLAAAGIGSIYSVSQFSGPGDPGGLLLIALAHGLAIAVMVTATGHISGGHLNPAVTFAMWINRQIKIFDGLVYIVAQIAGCAVGALLIDVAFPEKFDTSLAVPALGAGVSAGQGLVIEGLMTFFLVWVVFGVAVDRDGAYFKLAGLPIGLTVTLDILMGGPLTGAAMNPARVLGPALVFGEWGDQWVYWVGSFAGAAIAGLIYMYGIRPRLHSTT